MVQILMCCQFTDRKLINRIVAGNNLLVILQLHQALSELFAGAGGLSAG